MKKNILYVVVYLFAAVLLSAAVRGTARAEDATGPGIDNTRFFTITEIKPEDSRVNISFSAQCDSNFYKKIKIFPSAGRQMNFFNGLKNNIDISGNFKPGQDYTIYIPEGVECGNLKYQKTIDAFKSPDLASNITFVEEYGSVIERSGRQMLHVNITNVGEVVVHGLNLPLILVPFLNPDAAQPKAAAPTAAATNTTFAAAAATPKKSKKRAGNKNVQNMADSSKMSDSYAALISSAAEKLNALRPIIEGSPALKEFAGEITEERKIVPAGPKLNNSENFSIPLDFNKGMGSVTAVSIKSNLNQQYSESEIRLLRITDIGLTYKISGTSLLIWATSLNTGAPIENVSLMAFAAGAAVAPAAIPLGKTDKDGLLAAQNFDKMQNIILAKDAKPQPPAALKDVRFIFAASAADRTFAEVVQSKYIKPDWVPQSSERNAAQLKGHLFTERGIYRPGETVYFKGTVREFKNGAINPPADLAPAVKIVNSKGETVYQSAARLSAFGTTSGSLVVKSYFPLGTYTLSMTMPNNILDVNRTFQVQEFQPPRHFTDIHFTTRKKKDKGYKNIDKTTTFVSSEISGAYYAGGPVKNGKLRWKIYHNSTDFRKPNYKDYTFGNITDRQEELIESGESTLDEKGKAAVSIPMSKDVASGIAGLKVIATVVDFDGKASTESSIYQKEPGYLVGIGRHDESIDAGGSETLNVIVIDKAGKKVEKGKVTAEVLRKSYTYIRKRNEQGNVYWTEAEMFKRELKANIAMEKSLGSFDFDFAHGGDYIIKFTYGGPDGKAYTSSTGYHVSGGDYYGYEYNNKDRKFEKLSVSAERSEYAQGEAIRVLVNPHRKLASLLMTIEREGIMESRIIKITGGKNYIDIPVKKGYEPNVYISFLGTIARGEFPVYKGAFDDEAPAFLFGVVNVEIKNDPGELKVTINGDVEHFKAEPGAVVDLRLTSKDGEGAGVVTEMAVVVVDESVLNMTGFETPTLGSLNKFITMLSVFTGDLRSELLKQTPFHLIGASELDGGDGVVGKPEAATSKVRKDFNPVAYFNPAVVTDNNGQARVSFKLPDTMTTYRVYAVSADKGHRFASTQRGLLVVKDFYLEPGTPRFFVKGDKFKMYVSAFNKTGKAAPMQFTLGKDSLLNMTSASQNYNVDSMDRALVPVDGEAVNTGVSKLRFSGSLDGKADAVEIRVPVNSGYLMVSDVVFGVLSNGTRIRYNLPEGTDKVDWKDARPDAALLTISGSPFLRLSPGLKYLLQYPYGCVEQTSSGVLPLASLRGLIKDGLIYNMQLEDTDKFLQPGIARLLSMQTSSGGFGYWPGDMHPHKWGTVYASMALTTARLAGAEVPDSQLALAMNYLKGTLKDGSKEDRTYSGFVSYILALNGKLEQQAFQQEYKNIKDMSREGALLLLLSGRIMKYLSPEEAALQARPLLEARWNYNGSDVFYARYREPAISLIAANAIMPKDAITGNLAAQLIGGVNKQGIWTSTSDTGWSLMALGDYYKGQSFADAPVKVSIRQEGWPETTITLDPRRPYTYPLEPASFMKKPEINVFVTGGAAITYSLSLTYPRLDYAKSGYSNGFRIQKRIENTDGSKVINVGDVVKVTLDIDAEGDNFTYVVLDDPLPAGFVAINSAIKTEEYIPKRSRSRRYSNEDGDNDGSENDDGDFYYYRWSSWDYQGGFYRFTPSYFEMRDDRVLAFKNNVWRGRYQYTYYARAICEGEFILPSTKIQLMYDLKTVSYTPEGKVVINGQKTAQKVK